MYVRAMAYVIGTAGLALLAAVLWLPVDFGWAAPLPMRTPSDLAVLTGDCAFFATLRPADVARDRLVLVLNDQVGLLKEIENEIGVPLTDVERISFTLVAGEDVMIVRTVKPVAAKIVTDRIEKESKIRGRFGFKDKKEKNDDEKPATNEKKVAGKTILYAGEPSRWTRGMCVLDRHVFLRGNLAGMEALLSSKSARSSEFNDMVAQAGKHTLVFGVQGKQLRATIRRQEERFREDMKPKIKGDNPTRPGEAGKKVKKDEDEDLHLPTEVAMMIAPYKPLLMMKKALIVADIDKDYRANGVITFSSEEATEDGETAVKMLLYVIREMVTTLPREMPSARSLASVAESVRKAFKSAKVKRTGNTLETSVRLPLVAEGAAKKIKEEMAAERKLREERWRKERQRYSKDKYSPKDKQ